MAGKANSSDIAKITSDLTTTFFSKIDGGYAATTMLPNRWTLLEIPLTNKLNVITSIIVTPYTAGVGRMYAPVVRNFSPDKIVVAAYSMESVDFNAGFNVIVYGS